MSEPVRVLVVDDDREMCRVIEDLLTKRGFRVTTCTDSTQVMELLGRETYGCVLLDIRMKQLQGTDLLPMIKHHHAALPVVVVSAYCTPSDISYYMSLGAFDAVQKPFTSERLVEVINRAVGAADAIPLTLTTLSLEEARDQVYRKLILTALQRTKWNQVKAAQLLGVSRHSLIRWSRKLQITR